MQSGVHFAAVESPFRNRVFCFAANGAGVFWSEFCTDPARERDRLSEEFGKIGTSGRLLRSIVAQVERYFAKRLACFDVPLVLEGSEFECRVWEAVARLRFGDLVSYGEVAQAVGKPLGHRGVARAMGKAPLALFVPAHRVIGADRKIKGDRSGQRRMLLRFEGNILKG